MEYSKLAEDFFEKMSLLRRHKSQMKISESMRGETFILNFIAMRGERVIPSEISGEMNISTARIAAALGSMESKGLLTRSIDPDDRRRILVELTNEGKSRAAEHRQMMLGMIAKMFARLGEHDAREYVRITGRLVEIPPEHFECAE